MAIRTNTVFQMLWRGQNYEFCVIFMKSLGSKFQPCLHDSAFFMNCAIKVLDFGCQVVHCPGRVIIYHNPVRGLQHHHLGTVHTINSTRLLHDKSISILYMWMIRFIP